MGQISSAQVTCFRGFLEAHFDLAAAVLDVAGGRGDLAGQLANLHGTDAVVLDPRPQNSARLRRKWAQVVLECLGEHEVDIGKALARAAEAAETAEEDGRLALALATLRPVAVDAALAESPEAVARLKGLEAAWREPKLHLTPS